MSSRPADAQPTGTVVVGASVVGGVVGDGAVVEVDGC